MINALSSQQTPDVTADPPYLVEFNGECMGDLISGGTALKAVPGDPVAPLDMVSVLLAVFSGPWARFVNSLTGEGYAGLVKLFLGSYQVQGETVFLFGQLNPPTLVPIPASAVAAIHRIDFNGQCVGTDLEAFNLIAPFAGMGHSEPKGMN